MKPHTLGSRSPRHCLAAAPLLITFALTLPTACSRQEAQTSTDGSGGASSVEVISQSGVEVREHPPMPEITGPMRTVATNALAPADASAPKPEQKERPETLSVAEASAQDLTQANPRQTPATRLEARHQALEEMFRVRKAAEEASAKK